MGDSTTAGTPGWKSRIEAPPAGAGDQTSQYAWWLMQDEPDWEVLNHGVNGERSDQIRARFERDVRRSQAVGGRHHRRRERCLPGPRRRSRDRAARRDVRAGGRREDRASSPGSIVPYNTATADQNSRMRQINDWIRKRRRRRPERHLRRHARGGRGAD